MGFRGGEDWITSGGSQSKTEEANLTLTHIMNQVEVSCLSVQRQTNVEEGMREKTGGGWTAVMEK